MPRRQPPTPDPITELINAPCLKYPACICHHKLVHHIHNSLSDKVILSEDQIEPVTSDLACALSCLSVRCPDKRMRDHARIQMLHPIFASVKGRAH